MWVLKILLFVSFFNFLDSYAGPKNFGIKTYKHVIEVTEIGLENPIPYPKPFDDDVMVARGNLKSPLHETN